MHKEKIVLFVKKEMLFPDFWIFRKFNRFYYWLVFNFFLLRAIKKYQKDELVIVSDYQEALKLEKWGIKTKSYADYIEKYEHEDRYLEGKELIKRWFNFNGMKRVLNYKGFDLSYIVEERFSWWLLILLDYIDGLRKVMEKENPQKIVICSRHDIFDRCCWAIAKSKKIEIGYYSPRIIEQMQFIIEWIGKRILFHARFHNIPFIARREFVKTGNLEKIKTKEKNILALAPDKPSYRRIKDVIDELFKSKRNNVTLLCVKSNMQEEFRKQGIRFVSFGDFLEDWMRKDAEKKYKEIHKLWARLMGDRKFLNLFLHKKMDLWNLVKDELSFIFNIKLRWVLYYIETSKKLLHDMKIDSLTSIGELGARTRAITMAANSKSIPTLVVQNFIGFYPTGRFMLPLTANKVSVWGAEDKKYLENLGLESNRIVVNGSHVHDHPITGMSRKERDNIFEKLHLDKDKKTILLASQGYEGFLAEKASGGPIRLALGYIKNKKDEQMIIKLHPRQEKTLPEGMIKELGVKNAVIIKDEFNILDLTKICDIMVTTGSTVIYDAVLVGKPVIVVNLLDIEGLDQYIKSGDCFGVKKESEFIGAVNKAFKKSTEKKAGEGRKRFIKNYLYKMDYKATKRIARLIENSKSI